MPCRRGVDRRAENGLLAADPDLAAGRRKDAGQDLHQHRFAGAIVSDERHHLARRNRKGRRPSRHARRQNSFVMPHQFDERNGSQFHLPQDRPVAKSIRTATINQVHCFILIGYAQGHAESPVSARCQYAGPPAPPQPARHPACAPAGWNLSRAELARATGLTPQAVANIVDEPASPAASCERPVAERRAAVNRR